MASSAPGMFVLVLGPNRRRYITGLQRRVLRFAIPAGLLARIATYAGHRVTRMLDPAAGVNGGRAMATLIVLIIALWPLLVLTRALAGWKLVATMAMVAAISVLATGIFLLDPASLRVVVAAVTGAAGAVLAGIACRAVAIATRTSQRAAATITARRAADPGSDPGGKAGLRSLTRRGGGWCLGGRLSGQPARSSSPRQSPA